jgi:hypothetical protein
MCRRNLKIVLISRILFSTLRKRLQRVFGRGTLGDGPDVWKSFFVSLSLRTIKSPTRDECPHRADWPKNGPFCRPRKSVVNAQPITPDVSDGIFFPVTRIGAVCLR